MGFNMGDVNTGDVGFSTGETWASPRVNGRPIRHIFHRFQNVPASCERSLKAP